MGLPPDIKENIPLAGIEGDPRFLTEIKGRSVLTLNLTGARIEKLQLGEQLVLAKITRASGQIASTHPCVPIFGPETTTQYGLKQHGEARNQLWEQATEAETDEIVLTYEVNDSGYPPGLKVTQKFKLESDTFELTTTLANHGDESLPVNSAEHCYWDVRVQGWGGLTVNDRDITEVIQKTDVIRLKPRNIIRFPGSGRKPVLLEQNGLNYAVGWNEDPENTHGHWFCLEPVEGNPKEGFFGSDESMISPKSSRQTVLKISLLD